MRRPCPRISRRFVSYASVDPRFPPFAALSKLAFRIDAFVTTTTIGTGRPIRHRCITMRQPSKELLTFGVVSSSSSSSSSSDTAARLFVVVVVLICKSDHLSVNMIYVRLVSFHARR